MMITFTLISVPHKNRYMAALSPAKIKFAMVARCANAPS
jgi:hypothetical protein